MISYFIKNIGNKKKRFFILFIVLISFSYGSQDSLSINKKNNTLVDEWFAIDKVQHFMYSAFVSLGTQYVLVNKIQMDENEALPLSSLLSFQQDY